MEILIATSLIPRNIEIQKSAIATWRELGFQVISLNHAEEVDAVQKHFPHVPVEAVTNAATKKKGRPYVAFDSFRRALAKAQVEICGIVNSDIFLFTDKGFREFVFEKAKNGLLFGSRIDVDSASSRDGTQYVHGFDYFFFNKSILQIYPPSEFCLGIPWWDYWVPIVPLLKGFPCCELVSPIAFHVIHDTHWYKEAFLDLGRHFAVEFKALTKGKSIPLVDDLNSHNDMFIYALDVLVRILRCTDKIVYPYNKTNEQRIEVGQLQYLNMREGFIERHKRCLELEKQIDHLYNLSFIWRHAKLLLRWLKSKVRPLKY